MQNRVKQWKINTLKDTVKGNVIGTTRSLCPICIKVIDATLVRENDKISIIKNCMEDGSFKDIYWSDYELYKKFKNFHRDRNGLENPITKSINSCPYNCGLCENHKTTTLLANIDITNRCNMRCPICFASAEASGHIFEPTKEEIKKCFSY